MILCIYMYLYMSLIFFFHNILKKKLEGGGASASISFAPVNKEKSSCIKNKCDPFLLLQGGHYQSALRSGVRLTTHQCTSCIRSVQQQEGSLPYHFVQNVVHYVQWEGVNFSGDYYTLLTSRRGGYTHYRSTPLRQQEVFKMTYLGNHTAAVQRGLNLGVALFIVSEALFFLAIF